MKKVLLSLMIFLPIIVFGDPIPKGNSYQFRGSGNHIGEYQVSDRFGVVKHKWEFRTKSAVRSTPLAFENLILFGSGDHNFYALDSSNGKLKWKFSADAPVHSSPAVYMNTVFFNTSSNTLYAVEIRTGKLKWKKQLGQNLPYEWGFDYYLASPMIDEKILYTGSGDGNLYALDPSTGNVKWKHNVNARIRSTPAADEKKIYFGDVSGKVYALDKVNGSLAWQFSTIGDTLTNENFGFDRKAVIASPAIASNMVIVGGRDGYLYAINATTGEQTWQFNYQVSWVISSVAIKNNKVVSATSDGSFIHALDLNSGKELWRFQTTAPVWASPCIVNDKVIAAVNDGFIYSLNLESGKENWRYRTNDRIFSSPVPSNGNIYCGSDDGNMYALTGIEATPPNMVHRAVFWIKEPIFQFFKGGIDSYIRDYFTQAGYTRLDIAGLSEFLKKRVADGQPSVIVFATNIFPTQVTDSADTNLLLQYLNKGGKVVIMGTNPAAYKIDEEKKQIQGFDFSLVTKRIGITFPHKDLRSIEGFHPSTITAKGMQWGLRSPVNALSTDPSLVTEVLAKSETGRATCWVKNYGGKRGTGFVQTWITPATISLLPEIYKVAEYGLNE